MARNGCDRNEVPEVGTLSRESVSIASAVFSQVRALWDLGPPHSTQHVRNGCARNPYTPRVSSDPHAFGRKRHWYERLISSGTGSNRSLST